MGEQWAELTEANKKELIKLNKTTSKGSGRKRELVTKVDEAALVDTMGLGQDIPFLTVHEFTALVAFSAHQP